MIQRYELSAGVEAAVPWRGRGRYCRSDDVEVAEIWAAEATAALRRLILAAAERENTAGDPLRLLEAQGELRAAVRAARAVVQKTDAAQEADAPRACWYCGFVASRQSDDDCPAKPGLREG